jgi:predicted RNA binding protein YcfA (HicA-like mRNA interferase family)
MKVKAMIKLLEADGWYQIKGKGGHRQYKHPTKPGRVTVPGKMSDNLSWDTQQSIFRQAGWKQ